MAINLKPLGDRILVEPAEEKEVKKGGIIIPDSAKEKPQEGVVVALGTGKTDYGFGVELDKDVGPIFLFGDAGYTVIGKIPSLNFRNRPAAGFGIGKQVSENVTLSSMLDWRRSIIAGNPNPTELVGMLTYKAGRRVTLTPNAFVGLTDGSSDFGVGFQMGVKF